MHALRNADFALITFEEEEEAERAQRAAHGQTWKGKKIQVNERDKERRKTEGRIKSGER